MISILDVGGVRAGDSGYTCVYTDYTGIYVKCIHYGAECFCGSSDPSETFRPWSTDQQCCIPSGGSCTRKPGTYHDDGVCSEGRKLSMSTHCENSNRSLQCHNSYQDSQYIGVYSHFTCPNTCVPWDDMCRGVSWCEGDYEVCGPELRCPLFWLSLRALKRALKRAKESTSGACLNLSVNKHYYSFLYFW